MRGRVTTIAVALAAAAIGCGGGDDEPQPLSSAELTERVDATCADARRRLDELPAPESDEETRAYAEDADEIVTGMLDDLRALRGEGAAQTALDELLAVYDRSVETSTELAAAAREGDGARVEQLTEELQEIGDEARQVAEDAGFDACADA